MAQQELEVFMYQRVKMKTFSVAGILPKKVFKYLCRLLIVRLKWLQRKLGFS